jgi:hypothetical protein
MFLLSFWYKSNSNSAVPNVKSTEKLVILLLNAAVRRIGVTVRQRRLLESDICSERGHNAVLRRRSERVIAIFNF